MKFKVLMHNKTEGSVGLSSAEVRGGGGAPARQMYVCTSEPEAGQLDVCM